MADERQLPTGRVRRAANIGRLAGGEAAKAAATKAANLTRGKDARRDAAVRRQMLAAEQIVDVLGQMKGAAMKVGQLASFMDSGSLPPEVMERLQEKLAELRDSAPKVSFKEMKKVMESDYGERLSGVFPEFEEEPIAAASIGQVYRARLDDGREVAVKVQYPGVDQAVRADLQNLGMILGLAKRMAPGMDTKALAAEIRERMTEELDYEHEAQNQRAFARAWRGHPFVVVPGVVTDLSREHVLVTEFVSGKGFERVKEMDQATRNRMGEIVFRFFFQSLYRVGHFSGDPHPGNYLLLDDGRVAFLDFGMTKTLPRVDIDAEMEAVRMGIEGNAEALRDRMTDIGYYKPDAKRVDPDLVLGHFNALTSWYTVDGETTIDRERMREVSFHAGDPRSEYWNLMRHGNLPTTAVLARRMEGLVLGVLSQLEARANWHRIAREWLYEDPPATELGRQEAPFFGRSGAPAGAGAA
jgi:predicted unusual protein kinase regulating ubiquinone biosynthesis (AarF/ABC1/UbiB family)